MHWKRYSAICYLLTGFGWIAPAQANESASEAALATGQTTLIAQSMIAQSIDLPPGVEEIEPRDIPRPEPPTPSPPLQTLPPPVQLLPPPASPLPDTAPNVPLSVFVDRFEIIGSTVFTPAELAAVTAPFTGRELTFAELLQARSAVTQLYVDRGYVTSGAIIPPQTLDRGVVQIQVIEGRVEEINVSGTDRLRPSYVRDRLERAASTPLNVNRLLEGLQLLQLDPLIGSISADLQAGVQPGTSLLQVTVSEADSLSFGIGADNNRSPSVGSFRRQADFTQANLLGLGDALQLGYSNTAGSNGLDVSYTLPINSLNGTVRLAFGTTDSRVIEEPFDALDISATSRYYELSLRQPLMRSPTEEFALGLSFSRQESQTELGFNDIGPSPLSPGADDEGRTRISALRFSQDWTRRSDRDVVAVRSQFSLGLDLFDATLNDDAPDSRFLAWQGQGQWVRLLAPDALLLLRGTVQLADAELVPLEQFGLGGQATVRGYRQDALLTDNGALLSAEVRLPLLRVPQVRGVLQAAPFVDVGTAWGFGDAVPAQTIAGVGVGLLWQMGDDFSVRLDWGIPLIEIEAGDRSLQENGLYFSINSRF